MKKFKITILSLVMIISFFTSINLVNANEEDEAVDATEVKETASSNKEKESLNISLKSARELADRIGLDQSKGSLIPNLDVKTYNDMIVHNALLDNFLESSVEMGVGVYVDERVKGEIAPKASALYDVYEFKKDNHIFILYNKERNEIDLIVKGEAVEGIKNKLSKRKIENGTSKLLKKEKYSEAISVVINNIYNIVVNELSIEIKDDSIEQLIISEDGDFILYGFNFNKMSVNGNKLERWEIGVLAAYLALIILYVVVTIITFISLFTDIFKGIRRKNFERKHKLGDDKNDFSII